MVQKSLAEALDDMFGVVERTLARIEQRDEIEAELQGLQVALLQTLDLVERNPGIEAAADDLYSAASAFVIAQRASAPGGGRLNLNPARGRALKIALTRFRERLDHARPSERARALGLS